MLEAVITKASDSTTDIEIDRVSRAEYLNISQKSQTGTPVQYFLQRDTSAPTLFLYPTPDAADTFKYYGLTKIQDAGDYNDQLEVPTRFIPCLTSGLAYYVSIKKDQLEVPTRFIPCLTSGLAYYVSIKKAPERTALLKQLYEEEWQRASEEDRPRSSFFITPERGYI